MIKDYNDNIAKSLKSLLTNINIKVNTNVESDTTGINSSIESVLKLITQ